MRPTISFQTARKNPWLAAGLSPLVPGLRQIYNGDAEKGVVLPVIGYPFLLLSPLLPSTWGFAALWSDLWLSLLS